MTITGGIVADVCCDFSSAFSESFDSILAFSAC